MIVTTVIATIVIATTIIVTTAMATIETLVLPSTSAASFSIYFS